MYFTHIDRQLIWGGMRPNLKIVKTRASSFYNRMLPKVYTSMENLQF